MEKNLTWWQHLGRKVINQKDLERFLNSRQGHEQLKILVTETLLSKSEMLTEKIKKRSLLMESMNANTTHGQSENTLPINGETLGQIQELGRVFERMDKEYAKDQAELELTLLYMKSIQSNPELDQSVMASFINAGTSDEEMSKFLRKTMDVEIRSARGILFESQLEGARLRDKQFKDMTGLDI